MPRQQLQVKDLIISEALPMAYQLIADLLAASNPPKDLVNRAKKLLPLKYHTFNR